MNSFINCSNLRSSGDDPIISTSNIFSGGFCRQRSKWSIEVHFTGWFSEITWCHGKELLTNSCNSWPPSSCNSSPWTTKPIEGSRFQWWSVVIHDDLRNLRIPASPPRFWDWKIVEISFEISFLQGMLQRNTLSQVDEWCSYYVRIYSESCWLFAKRSLHMVFCA